MQTYTRVRALCWGLGMLLVMIVVAAAIGARLAYAQRDVRPAFVIVERLATTGDASIQEQYAALAREILPKYAGRYLARSQRNILLEGSDAAPCCVAILEFPSMESATRWYASAENQAAVRIRNSGAAFRLVAIEGLSSQK